MSEKFAFRLMFLLHILHFLFNQRFFSMVYDGSYKSKLWKLLKFFSGSMQVKFIALFSDFCLILNNKEEYKEVKKKIKKK